MTLTRPTVAQEFVSENAPPATVTVGRAYADEAELREAVTELLRRARVRVVRRG